MTPVLVTKVTTDDKAARAVIEGLGGAKWAALKKAIARDMQTQVTANLVKRGQPSGDWPKLSGFNANRATKKGRLSSIRGEKRMLVEGFSEEEQGYIRAGRRFRTLTGREEKAKNLSPHLGYARRKDTGKTPGNGQHTAGVRLRDTRAMRDGVTAVITGNVIEVVSVGQVAGRPSNNDLLVWHATGAGNLPVRNCAEPKDMAVFERRVADRLASVGSGQAAT